MRRITFLLLGLLIVGSANLTAADDTKGKFPLQNGDIWVMAGDSITAQHLHSNYFEAFCFARYPQLKFAFRNSGVGGHTIPSTLARFDYDIGAWKPTVVSVELGMNDKGGTETAKFIANMGNMVKRIRDSQARPVILAPSPVNNGETMANLAGNKRLSEYSKALKNFAEKEGVPYADQFHLLVDVWGKNKSKEVLANALTSLRQAAMNDKLAGVEHLRAFLAAQDKSGTRLVSLQGDPVHPGAPGQLMMAAALLKELGADPFVSSVSIDAGGKIVQAKGCKVEGLAATEGKLAFDRLDERGPFPIPDEARGVLALDPTILDMSQYTLAVTGLKDGTYKLKINGIETAGVTAKDLATGVNLTAFGPMPKAAKVNPIVAQGRAILNQVAIKEGLVSQWRSLSQKAHAKGAEENLKEQLAALTKKVEAADEKIRAAARPAKLRFELELVN